MTTTEDETEIEATAIPSAAITTHGEEELKTVNDKYTNYGCKHRLYRAHFKIFES